MSPWPCLCSFAGQVATSIYIYIYAATLARLVSTWTSRPMAPPWGSQRREPQNDFWTKKRRNKANSKLVTKYAFFTRICIIFCMCKAVYISNGFRMRAGPLKPLNALKTKICFGAFSTNSVFILFRSPWGYGCMVPQWGHRPSDTTRPFSLIRSFNNTTPFNTTKLSNAIKPF